MLTHPLVDITKLDEGEYVVLSVLDQGPGISDEDLDRIFEPFYSKKVMGRSGTGLGLTIVWNVTQDHNGHINVLSSDMGTKFNIYFPITRKSKPYYESSFDISDLRGNGELILIVDDVGSQREITTTIIEKLGYKAESVPSGEAAIDYIMNRPVDLVLLDMIMTPGINGRKTYEKILQIHPKQKAIIVSGYADNDEVQKTLKLGASFFLMKPITIQELGVAIHGVFNNSSANNNPIDGK
jgi:CheY-like chemotaxis protein